MRIADRKDLLRELVARLERHVPYASAFGSESTGGSAAVRSKSRSVGFTPPARGVTLTVFTGREFLERSTDDLGAAALRALARDLLADARASGVVRPGEIEVEPGEPVERDFRVALAQDPRERAPGQLLDETQAVHDRGRALSPKILSASASFSHWHQNQLFVNRAKVLYQELHCMETVFGAVLGEGDHRVSVHGGHARQGGLEHQRIDDATLRAKVALGESLLRAGRLPAGTYDCVVSPNVAGLLAHESLGHGTETDTFLKGRAKGYHYMGRPVGARCVNLYDSPALPGLPGSYFFDDEGQLAAETRVIVDGVLVSGLTDLNSALRLGYARTPNGRREEYSHKPYARMTNTYFGPGSDRFEDMVASIEHGYLVDEERNGMEDPKEWGIQCEALAAREIRHGKLTDSWFTPVIITGTVPELLASLSMVGDRVEFVTAGAWCGKGQVKELVRTAFGGPYMKLRARLA